MGIFCILNSSPTLSHISLPNPNQFFCLAFLFPDNFAFTFIQVIHTWVSATIYEIQEPQ